MRKEKLLFIIMLILIGAFIFQETETREEFTYLEFPKSQGILQYTEKILAPEMLKK
jgi:hypothetical protein